jgi:hypothetical protein
MDTPQVQGGKVPARPEGYGDETRSHKLKVRAISGGKTYFGIFLYLYVVFALFNMHEYIVLAQHGIDFTHYGFAAVNAFVMAKVLLIGEELHFGEYVEDRPLIYPILLSSLLFGILLIAFHIVEHVIVGLWHGQTMVEAIPSFGGGGLTGIVMVGTIISVTLIPFFALRYVRRVIGAPELYTLLFLRGRKDVTIEVKIRPQSGGKGAAGTT